METNNDITKRINESSAYSSRVAEMVKIVVCNYYNLPITIFQSKSRKREVIICKQTVVYFLRKQLPKATLKHIGAETGYDHASVIHCLKTTQNLIDIDKQTAVEWLLEYCDRENWSIPNNIIEQAKAMEKEQIINAFGVGCQVESTRLIGY